MKTLRVRIYGKCESAGIKDVGQVIGKIHTESEILHDLDKNKKIDIVGSMYDVTSGNVKFYNDIWHAPENLVSIEV